MKSTLRRRVLATFAAILMTFTGITLTSTAASAASIGYTTAALTVRSGTNTSTAALTTIPHGAQVNVQCQAKGQAISGTYNSDWWAKVTYNGRTGYVSRAYVRIPDASNLAACGTTTTPAPTSGVAGYATDTVSVRAGASTANQYLTAIPAGARETVQCQIQGQAISGTYNTNWWAKVTYNGRTGYASRAYLRIPNATGLGVCSGSTTTPPPPSTGLSASRQRVIDNGMSWVNQGVPYSMYQTWPGADGRQYRRDCSGMVSQAYGIWNSAYYLNTPSTETLINYFYPISKSSLQRGDIIGNLGRGSAGAAGHVVIFDGWANSSKTQFWAIESYNGEGTPAARRIENWGTSFWNGQAWRRIGW